MKAGRPCRFAAPLLLIAALASMVAAIVISRPSCALAAVEYVKICNLYGAEFFYLPGTDICVNVATNDARERGVAGSYLVSQLPTCPHQNVFVTDATDSSCTPGNTPVGGATLPSSCEVECVGKGWQFTGNDNATWQWRVPNNPRTLAPNLAGSCQGGQLVKFGDISSSDLSQNARLRWQTSTPFPLNLKQGQYIGSVLYEGGFTGVGGRGNFCMYYANLANPDFANPVFPPLGCIDTSSQAGVATFSPDVPIPPSSITSPSLVGANGYDWKVTSAADIQGTLSIWLCLQGGHGQNGNQQ